MQVDSVFIDTSAIYALFWENDFLHDISKEILEDLLKYYNVNLITSEFVYYESLSKLKKHGIHYCEKFEELTKKPFFIKKSTSAELLNIGLRFFWNYDDKTWGIVDCISFAHMDQNNLYYVFSVDIDFEQNGYYRLMKMDNNTPIKNYSNLLFT